MLQGSVLTPALDIAEGSVTGTSGVASGSLASSATSIQAIRATAYTEQTTASNLEIVSSSANDASAGTGTRTLLVTYYRSDGSGPFTATVTMNGTTAVAIGDSSAMLVEKMESLTVGSNGTNVGTITIRRNGGGSTVGTIAASDGRTFWAHHYVALNARCFVRALVFGAQTVSVSCFLRKIAYLTANAFEEQITARVRTITAQNSVPVFYENLWVTGPARITAYTAPDAVTAGSIFADIDFYEIAEV
jgi:hypothetical protein